MERGDKMVEKERREIEFILSFAWNYTSKMQRGVKNGKKEERKKGRKRGVETKEGINDAILLMMMVMFPLITRSQVFQLRM